MLRKLNFIRSILVTPTAHALIKDTTVQHASQRCAHFLCELQVFLNVFNPAYTMPRDCEIGLCHPNLRYVCVLHEHRLKSVANVRLVRRRNGRLLNELLTLAQERRDERQIAIREPECFVGLRMMSFSSLAQFF